MKAEEVLALVREVLLADDPMSRKVLADIYEELGDLKTAALVRKVETDEAVIDLRCPYCAAAGRENHLTWKVSYGDDEIGDFLVEKWFCSACDEPVISVVYRPVCYLVHDSGVDDPPEPKDLRTLADFRPKRRATQ